MSEVRRLAGEVGEGVGDTRRYVGVIVVEVLVLTGIWLIQRYFGA